MSKRVLRSLVPATALALLLALPVFGYEGEVNVQVDVDGPSRAVCPAAVSATVTVVDGNGNPQAGVQVTWSTGEIGTTNASGQHTITVNLSGDVEVTAAANGAVGRLLIDCVTGEVLGSVGAPSAGGLPRTDTATPTDAAPAGLLPSGFGLLLGALGLLLGALGLLGFVVRRGVDSRRP